MLKQPKKPKIKVGFLVQMPELWDKQKDVFDEMNRRDNIETVMLVVPPYDMVSNQCIKTYENNYFLQKYPSAIKAVDDNGKAIDVKMLNIDYLFFQRPYDRYLPKELKSHRLVKYCKLCYIPYGYENYLDFLGLTVDKSFCRNLRFYFFSTNEYRKAFQKYFKTAIDKGLCFAELLGYPEFEHFLNLKEGNCKKILWAPRWTYDETYGGSHFFEYKEEIIKLKEKHPEIEITIRPHPLMFDNFVSTGMMTQQEVQDYTDRLKQNGIELSLGKPLLDDFNDSGILISDPSGIIPMFFVSGKPIISCGNKYSSFTSDWKEAEDSGVYHADNWNEIENIINDLISGTDILKEPRTKTIEKSFHVHKGAYKRIVDRIVEDGIC